ncbi:hypothetical protein IFM89_011898 [Coptis chinensis]|uniref:TF-B3 domain-containing protein n=1 Tax=Coptis chinensis TaxID=261450 RepID=A0A835LVB9_9MAGN|nr:hypothetical protein IFM89_011898 [Coptis chinensis]
MQGIPKKFACKHRKYLPDVVVLKVPSGDVWRVEVKRVDENGVVWLQNGLQEFIEHHSISVGNFLVFDYDGKSQFDVHIFNMSGNEIDYIPNGQLTHGEKCHLPKQDGVDSNAIRNIALGTRKPAEIKGKNGVTQTASSFKSKHPFFQIVMTPSYVNKGYLHIPSAFWRRYLPEGLKTLTLQVANGRKKWLVRCSSFPGILRISKGFHLFVLESHIKIGDICVFEQIKRKGCCAKSSYIYTEVIENILLFHSSFLFELFLVTQVKM